MLRHLIAPVLILLSALLLFPVIVLAGSPALSHQLAQVRRATAKYHNVAKALADGYVMDIHCVELPGVGAMGYHFVNPALMADPTLNIEQPEILLYRKLKNGKFQLVGVEYLVFAADVTSHPHLFGRPLHGPMPGHGPGMPVHYDLHAWVWKHNPAGIFEDWNPSVRCP